jgi:hypothetical protein
MARADGIRRRCGVLAAAFVAAAALASATSAAPPPGTVPPAPGIAQYVEDIPTASGPRPAGARAARPGSGGEGGTGAAGDAAGPASLPAPVLAQVEEEGGEDAEQLKDIATSPAFGAPQDPPSATGTPGGNADGPNALGATADAVASGGSGVKLLLVLVTATTLVVGAGAVVKRRWT